MSMVTDRYDKRLGYYLAMNKETLAMDFWGRIEERQKSVGMTLRDACEKAGINYGTAVNQKSNATLPSLIAGALLAKELGTTVEWLLFGSAIVPSTHKNLWNTFVAVADKEELYEIVKKLPQLSTKKIQAIGTLLDNSPSQN